MSRESFRRLGGGEFERDFIPIDYDLVRSETSRNSLEDARERFLRACAQVEPRLLESLVKRGAELREWGKRWSLNELWCLRWAQRELIWLQTQKKRSAVLKSSKPAHIPVQTSQTPNRSTRRVRKITGLTFTSIALVKGPPPTPEPLLFEIEGWRIQEETRRIFKERATAEIYRVLTSYCDKVENDAEHAGFRRTPDRRNREGDHFEWLAKYQVLGWSFKRIAESINVDKRSVERAIHGLAEQLPIKLRSRARH